VISIVGLLHGLSIFIEYLYGPLANTVDIRQLTGALTIFIILDEYAVLYSALEKTFHHDAAAFIEAFVRTGECLVVGLYKINLLNVLFRGVVIRPHFALRPGGKDGDGQEKSQA